MFRFATPEYLYLLAAIPVAAMAYIYALAVRKRALERFGDMRTVMSLCRDVSMRKPLYKLLLLCGALACTAIAMARPQFGSKLKEVTREGIEIMIAVDVSNSMLAQDFEPNRLERTKYAIDRLTEQLTEDKIGLIVFAGSAYMQLPITSDYTAARNFVKNVSPNMVSRQGTAIGAAIDLAARSFSPGSEGSRVLIVVSDGENHEDDPLTAAENAAKQGIKIYTIGIGTPEGAPIQIGNDFLKDENGEMVVSKLDETTLEKIALSTEGAYIRATNRSIGLDEIIGKINDVEKQHISSLVFEDFNEQYQYFVGLALILLLADSLVIERRNRIFSKFSVFK